jgi:hypothetical protein
MSEITTEAKNETKSEAKNEAIDSCDTARCSSRVLVMFGKVDADDNLLQLAFCGHHGNDNYVTLTRQDWVILDDDRVWKIEDPRGTAAAKQVATAAEAKPARLGDGTPPGNPPEAIPA